MSTADNTADKIEATAAGIKLFVLSIVHTIRLLLLRPRQLVARELGQAGSEAVLGPNAFLIVCAIAFGFLGKSLAAGFEHIGLHALQQIMELKLSSFLVQTVAVFAIALAGSWAVDFALRDQDAAVRQQIKNLNGYVIAFFGVGSLVVLFMLSLLLSLIVSGDGDFSRHARLFALLAVPTVGGYVIAMYALMQWMALQVLRVPGLPGSGLRSLRLAAVNAGVLALCILNLLGPQTRAEGAALMQGTWLDLERRPDEDGLRLSFLLSNRTDAPIALDQTDRHGWTWRIDGAVAWEAEGAFDTGCGLEPPERPYLMLDPGKTMLLVSCVSSRNLPDALRETSFAEVDRQEGRKRLQPRRRGALVMQLEVSVVSEGLAATRTRVKLDGI